ncbi:MAG: hypothetical protein QOF78_1369 [Phycisphaerales bacterium]|nr:hypothetical protein [Phycisphaerales bacterium]
MNTAMTSSSPHSHLRRTSLIIGGVIVSLALAGGGCARSHGGGEFDPQSRSTDAAANRTMAADPMSSADQPGTMHEQKKRNDLTLPAREPIEGVSKTVQENVTPSGAYGGASSQPTTAAANGDAPKPPPATRGATVGEFFTIGGVIAEVNGTAIYANKVLHLVEPVLAARAKELDRERFKMAAEKELRAQRNELVKLELEYAAAERNLEARDKDMAELLTQQWRTRQITEAGGSEELARRNAPEIARRYQLNPSGSFDELVSETYRTFMSRLYYEKKIMPRIQVSAAEMRDYYDRNREQYFSQRAAAQFRLIKIDVKKAGGHEPAMRKITELRNRIVKAGEPFESIARSVNDNPLLLRTGGSVKIDQGAFAVKEVDDAVWSTPEGQVTEVIDAADALYIAQVLERKLSRVQPFEEEAVQARIADDLRSRDFREMRRKVLEQLEQDAVIRSDPAMMNTVLEMAMQNYSRWAGK